MGLERLALFLNGHDTVWETDELHELTVVVGDTLGVDPDQLDGDAQRSLRIVTDHLRASLAIAAAGIAPSASRQGYVLRKLIRRAVRHAELLKGTDQGLAQSLIEATDRVSDVMGRRWTDVGPGEGGDLAKATIEKESSKFAKTLRKGVDHLQELADERKVFDGDLAFRLADTLGYPVELSAEEAAAHRDDRSTTRWPAPLRGAPRGAAGPLPRLTISRRRQERRPNHSRRLGRLWTRVDVCAVGEDVGPLRWGEAAASDPAGRGDPLLDRRCPIGPRCRRWRR